MRPVELLEACIGLFAPRRAAVRAHWRKLREDPDYRSGFELGLRMRGYKAAKTDSQDWANSTRNSADAEIVQDLPNLRYRIREINRDDSIGSGVTKTFVRGVIGAGLRPQARTGDDVKDDALEAVWADRAPHLSIAEGRIPHEDHQALLYSSRISDGEVFVRPAQRGPFERLYFEVIEADRVHQPPGELPRDPGGRIVNGIEKDRHGVVVAYWVLKRHPGDFPSQTRIGSETPRVSSFSREDFVRVPADEIYHEREPVTRSGQTNGVPKFHASLQDLRDMDLLMLATLKRTQIAACLAAFLTSSTNSNDLIELTAEDYGYSLDQNIEPGMIFRLFPGENVTFQTPPAGLPNIESFMMLLARRVGAAVGLSPQAVLKNWDGSSYSGSRTIKAEDRQTFRIDRMKFSGGVLKWEWMKVQEEALLLADPRLVQARVTKADIGLVDWIGDEEAYVDPQVEAAATKEMLGMGLTTYQIECARLGRDWKENLRQQQMEAQERQRLGVPNLIKPAPVAAPAAPRGQLLKFPRSRKS